MFKRIIADILKSTDLFIKLTERELFEIASWSRIIIVQEGVIIIKEGLPGNCLYIIIEGDVDVFSINKKSNICVLANLKVGDHFGELALLNKNSGLRNASVMANNTTKLIQIPSFIFSKILDDDKALHLELCIKKEYQKFQNNEKLENNVRISFETVLAITVTELYFLHEIRFPASYKKTLR